MISTIDRESTSRSSVNDLSSWTSSVGTPATSFTISARSVRTSSVVGTCGSPWVEGWCGAELGQDDDLARIDQAGAEADDQTGVAGLGLARLEQGLDGQRDRRRRGVALASDVAGDHHLRRQLERPEHGVGDPHVGLVRGEHLQVLGTYAGGVERLGRRLGHGVGGPLEDRVALHPQLRPVRRLALAHGLVPRLRLADQRGLLAVGAPDHGTDPGRLARSDHRGPGAVGEDERRRPVVLVGHVRQPLHADDQYVLGGAGADERVGHRRGVAEPGARCGDVEGRRPLGAELGGDRGGHRRSLVQVGDRGHDDRVDLSWLDSGPLQRGAGGGDRHHLDGLVGAGPAPLDDPGPGPDPLVAGVDHRDDLGVVDHPARPVAADAQDGRGLGTRGEVEHVHLLTSVASALSTMGWRRSSGWPGETGSPFSTSHSTTMPPCGALTGISSRRLRTMPTVLRLGSTVSASTSSVRTNWPLPGETTSRQVGFPAIGVAEATRPCWCTKASASSSWSGVFNANSSTPFRLRLASPVRVPAGGISSSPVTPRSAIVARHRSQRTGEATWPTSRRSTSRPSCTTWPSALDSSRVRGSWVVMARARLARWATAGSMCTVWKAPATLSGISRARAGGAAASAASCSVVPAATIWPVPLELAAVSPWRTSAASTSSGLPPTTAVIEVGVTALAAAMARPRSRTSTIACSADSTPTPAAAVISPTECPAATPMKGNASAGCGKSSRAASSPEATSSGCAIAVSRMVSASASVP